jgi:hypothetical protein
VTSRRRTAVGLAAAAILIGGIAAWALTRAEVVQGGPLAHPRGYRDSVEFTVPLRTPYSWGLVILRNNGDDEATVERVTAVDPKGSMRIVGLYAVSERAPDAVGFAPGFDPELGRGVEGLVVPPGRGKGYQLVFGVQADRSGISSFRAIRVEYRVGDTRYAATFDQAVVLCAPVERYETCPSASESVPSA